MKILKYGIFCILVLAASIMIRRPGHMEKGQSEPQVPQSPELPALMAKSAPASPTLPREDIQKPSPLVAKPLDEHIRMESPPDEKMGSPFTMIPESTSMDSLFGSADDDQDVPFGGAGDLFSSQAESRMMEAWSVPPSDENPFGDDQALSFGEDNGSGFFSDDASSGAFSGESFDDWGQE